MTGLASSLVFLLSVLVPFAAHAEIFKCMGPSGVMIYSDNPCGPTSTVLRNIRANTIPAIPFERSVEVLPQPLTAAQPPLAFNGQVPFVPNHGECDRARRNADTAASSSTSTRARRDIAEQDINITCFGSAAAASIEQAKAGAPKVIVNQGRSFYRRCTNGYCIDPDTPIFLVPRPRR